MRKKNFNLVQVVYLFFDRVENFVGKGENADYYNLCLSQSVFTKLINPLPHMPILGSSISASKKKDMMENIDK